MKRLDPWLFLPLTLAFIAFLAFTWGMIYFPR